MKSILSIIRHPEVTWTEVNSYEARRNTNSVVSQMRVKLQNR